MGLTKKAENEMEEKRPKNAVILAAGFGMRMVPINVEVPKGILEVHGEPLIERLIRQLLEAGVKEIDIVVEYGAARNILIEVKYREGAPIADDDSIVEMSDQAVASIVVTKNADDFGVHNTKNGKDLIRIPAFAFLYLLGHAEKHGYHGMDIQ